MEFKLKKLGNADEPLDNFVKEETKNADLDSDIKKVGTHSKIELRSLGEQEKPTDVSGENTIDASKTSSKIDKTKEKLRLADQSLSTKKPDFSGESCRKCGNKLREGSVICTSCGTKTKSGVQVKGAGKKSSKLLTLVIIILLVMAVGAKIKGLI